MKTVRLFPNQNRTAWGIRYFLFQLLVLPYLVAWLNSALSLRLDDAKLNMLLYTVNFAALVGIFWRFLGASLRHALENIGAVLLAAAIGFLAHQFSSAVVGAVLLRLDPDFFNVNDANIASMVRDNLPMWAFATVVLVPPAEELLFRGVLFGGFYSRSKVAAWVLSVLGFALIHVIGYVGYYPWDLLLVCALQYLPAGICFAAAYLVSGNILTPILIHSAINALAMLSMTAI